MNENIKDESNLLRGYLMLLYFSGSMIMFDPSRECVYDFWTKGMLKQLPVSSSNPDFIRAAAILRESAQDNDGKYELLTEDFFRLFSGGGTPLAPPFESVYSGEEKMLFGKETIEVRNFYKKYGWESRLKNNIPDDHLGIELLFFSHLIEKYISVTKTEDKIITGSDILSFAGDHLLSWLPHWVNDVNRNARSRGYRGISLLLMASVVDICQIIENQLCGLK